MAIIPTRSTGVFRDQRVPDERTRSEVERDGAARVAFRQRAEAMSADREQASSALERDPDRVARASRLAPWVGQPPELVESDLERWERQRRATEIREGMASSRVVHQWYSDPTRAAVSNDDYGVIGKIADLVGLDMREQSLFKSDQQLATMAREATNSRMARRNQAAREADGFFSRMGASFSQGLSSLESGLFTVGGALNEFGARIDRSLGRSEAATTGDNAARSLRASARATREGEQVRGGTTWEDVKANPVSLALPSFIAEQGAASIPGMIGSVVSPFAFGASMSGQIGQQRAQNNGQADADLGDILAAAPAATASVLLERIGVKGIFGAAGTNASRRIAGAALTEGATEFAQSGLEYAGGTVGTDAGFKWEEAFDQALAGAVAGAGMGAGFRSVQEGVQTTARRAVEVIQARTGERTLDQLMNEAAASKTRERDPRLFEQFIAGITQGTPLQNMFVPAEAIRELYQSNGWEMGVDGDGHMSALAEDFWQQVDAGLASGGDVVIPMEKAAAYFAGTPEWEDIKGAVRLSPGGISPNEAATIEDSAGEVMANIARQVEEQARAEREAAAPRERVWNDILSQARAAGFSLNSARAYADLWAARYETRAARLGNGQNAYDLFTSSLDSIRTDLPERVKPYRKGDNMDVLINAMRERAEPMAPRAPSLIEAIVEGGGVIDEGGDIRAMGGREVVSGGIFGRRRKSLIRERDDTGDMLGGDANADYGLDTWALRLWEAGYFPDRLDRPDVNDLLDAIGTELRGDKIYPAGAMEDPIVAANNEIVRAADDLRDMLESIGVQPDTASREEIEQAIGQWEREQVERSFDQSALPETIEVDGVSRPTTNSAGRPLAADAAGVAAFWRWFGDSKVVDAESRPLILYHGTVGQIEAFNGMAWAATDIHLAREYSFMREQMRGVPGGKNILPVYMKIERLFDADALPKTVTVGSFFNEALEQARANGVEIDVDRAQELLASIREAARREESGPSYDRHNFWNGAGVMFGEDGQAAIAEMFALLGFDGVQMRESPNYGERGEPTYGVFDPANVKSIENRGTFDPNDARILYQSQDQGGARGRIDFLGETRAAITLFEGRDLSTLLHEGGHLWLEELRADAVSLASGKVFADWETVKAWFKREGFEVSDDGEIPTEAHELWARGMERYFMEGQAPSGALARAFQSFRAWLLRIYQVVANLRSNIDDDVRKVFDRMLATDDAIAWAIHEADERALFETVIPEGMSAQEVAAYRDLVAQSRTEAFDALLYRTMERVRRQRTAAYQDDKAAIRARVAEDIEKRPEFKAISLMRGVGSQHMPLARDAVIEVIGRDALKLLPRGVPPTVVEQGADPEVVADLAGFPDARTMLETLLGVEERTRALRAAGDKRSARDEAIDIETERRLAEKYADAFDDGSIEEEALEIIQTDAGSERLASELRQLSRAMRSQDAPPTPLQAVRTWAERTVRGGRIVDQATGAAVARHRKAKSTASKTAERAYLEGRMDDAYKAKQKEMIAAELWRASRAAQEEVDVIARRLDRLARARTLKGMDQDYLDRIHELLENHDLRRRSQEEVKERTNFEKWRKEQEDMGFEVFVPERLTMAGNKHFTRMTVDEIVALDDAVQSLAHLGREKKKLLVAQEEREFQALIDEAQQTALEIPLRAVSTERNDSRDFAAEAMAGLLKVEFLADKMDNYNPNGVWNRVLVQGATEAANEKDRLQRQVLDPLAKLYLDMPLARKRRMQRRITIPEFVTIEPGTGAARPTTFTHSELIAVALNIGNASNLEKMIAGENRQLPGGDMSRWAWNEPMIMDVLNRHLDLEDWQFVQAVWTQINSLWPDIARSERILSGVEPEKIEPRKVSTAYGEFEGGYYPMVYDPLRSQVAADNATEDAAKLLGNIGRSIATPKGHTITRTEAAYPVHFNLERVLFGHVNKVTTRIAYGKFVRDALAFTNHPTIRKLVIDHAGPEYHKLFKSWLARQVGDSAMDLNMLSGIDRVLRKFRVNSTLVGLGFRFTTMLAQVGGWSNAAKEIGPQWLGRGVREMLKDMGSIRGWVFAQSPEMAARSQEFDRDVRAFYRDAGSSRRKGSPGWVNRFLDAAETVGDTLRLDKVRAAAFWGIGMIDVYMVAMPTWIGAYYRAIEADGMETKEAIAYADKAVRKSQTGGRAKDLSHFQDDREAYRAFTMFYSYFNVQLNQQWEAVQLAKRRDYRRVASNVFWILMLAPLAGATLTGDWPTPGEDEELGADDWLAWATSRIFFGLWAGLPFARDIASGIQRTIDGDFVGPVEAPIYRAFNELERPVGDAIKAAKGEEPSDRWLRNTITPAGYFFGLPTGQLGNTAQYVLDLAQGDQRPDDVGELAYGIAKGPQKDQE